MVVTIGKPRVGFLLLPNKETVKEVVRSEGAFKLDFNIDVKHQQQRG